MGVAWAELDPDQNSDGGQQQPRREQDVQAEAEDAQRHDGDEGNDNDPKHFRSGSVRDSRVPGQLDRVRRPVIPRLPPKEAPVDPDQPWLDPGPELAGIGAGPDSGGWLGPKPQA